METQNLIKIETKIKKRFDFRANCIKKNFKHIDRLTEYDSLNLNELKMSGILIFGSLVSELEPSEWSS